MLSSLTLFWGQHECTSTWPWECNICVLQMKISIQLLWGSVNESRKTIVVTSLINIQTWQECLNYLQPHLQHSNHFSTSQSPSALLSFNPWPDQLFFLSLWFNLWTWQDCFNNLHSYPWHSNYCSWSTSQSLSAPLIFIPDQLLFYLSDWISEFGRIASIFCSHILYIPITAHHPLAHPNLKPKSFKHPFSMHIA